jgi:type I restriction enzyme S subunit
LRKTAIEKLDQLTQSVFLHIFFSEKSERQGLPVVQIEDIALKEKGSMRTGPFGSDLLHSEFVDNGIAVLGIDNAVNNKFEWGERRYISKEKYKKLKRYTIYPGDVIVTIMGTTGRSAVIPQNIPLAINTKHLAAITLDKGIVNPYFISYSIHSDPFILNQIKLRDRGAIMSGLNLTIIKNLKIKLPPLNMQNKFASILQKIEKQQEAMKVSSKKMDENFNSILQRAFKGELAFNDDYFKRLGQNTGDYS